jgi:hypothetical protein
VILLGLSIIVGGAVTLGVTFSNNSLIFLFYLLANIAIVAVALVMFVAYPSQISLFYYSSL